MLIIDIAFYENYLVYGEGNQFLPYSTYFSIDRYPLMLVKSAETKVVEVVI